MPTLNTMAEKKQKSRTGEEPQADEGAPKKEAQTAATKEGKQAKQQQAAKPLQPAAKPEKIDETLRYIVRVAGTDLDGRKPIRSALPKIRGVGMSMSNAIIKAMNLDGQKKLGRFTEDEIAKIEQVAKQPASVGIPKFVFNRRRDMETGNDMHVISADMEMASKRDIEFMKKIRSYRGVRHFYGMKLRGQRTGSRGAGMHGRSGKTIGVLRTKLMAQAKEQAAAGEKGKKEEAKK